MLVRNHRNYPFGKDGFQIKTTFLHFMKKNKSKQLVLFSEEGALDSYAFLISTKNIHACYIQDNKNPDKKCEFWYDFSTEVLTEDSFISTGEGKDFLTLFYQAFDDLAKNKAQLMMKGVA